MTERDAVLFANEAFYRAFADRDIDAMEDVWAEDEPVTCIHPGWGLVHGRDKVMQSWLAILGSPQSPAIDCRGARAFVRRDAAHVVCFEEIDGNYLIATNYFVRENGRWRMVHHQAGPTSDTPPADEPIPRGAVN
jgi:hypothetical protein